MAKPNVSSSIDVSDRHDKEASPTSSPAAQPATGSTLTTDIFKNIEQVLNVLFAYWKWLLLIAVFALILVLVYFLSRIQSGTSYRNRGASVIDNRERDRTKATDLPFELAPSTLSLLAQSDAYRRAGDYSRAMVYLFSHSLVELDAAGLIRLEKGKTNRVYLHELAKYSKISNHVSTMIKWFEFTFFGKHVLNAETFDAMRDRLPELEATIQSVRHANLELKERRTN